MKAGKWIILCLAIGAVAFSFMIWWRYDELAGAHDAERDIANGELRIKSHGLPPRCLATYEAMLRQRYGIELQMVAGCVVDDRLAGHTKAYNEPMEREIVRRFGRHALDDTREDAQAQYEKEIAKPAATIASPANR